MAYSKIILNGETLMDVTSDTVAAGSLLSGKTATKNDGTKVTGNIASKTASDLTASGATVTAAAGYYPSAVSKAVTTTTHPNPTAAIASSTGVVTATHTQTTGYVTSGTTTGTLDLTTKAAATINTSTADQTIASYRWLTGTQTIKSVTTTNLTAANIASGVVVKVGDANNASRITQVTGTYAPAVSSVTVTPTETTQTFNATGVYGYKPVTINGISSTYVGTGIARKSSTDVAFASATATFTAPIGYYSAAATKTLTTQAAQTIYPSTADQTVASYRWLTGNQTFKSVTTTNLTAANIVSGTVVKVGDSANASRITQVTGTYSGIIPTGTLTISSAGTHNVYNYASASVKAGAATTPATTISPGIDAVADTSGIIHITASGSSSITPTVTSGYVTGGTAGTVTVDGGAAVPATTLDSNLVAGNIASGATIFGVAGSYEGDGGGPEHTLTITGTGNSTRVYVEYEGVKYYQATSFTFKTGKELVLHVAGTSDYAMSVKINGTSMSPTGTYQYHYTYTLPDCDVNIELYNNTSQENRYIYLTTPQIDITANGIYDITHYGMTSVNVTTTQLKDFLEKSTSDIASTDLEYTLLSQLSEIGMYRYAGRNFFGISSSIYAPYVKKIGSYAFVSADNFASVHFPVCSTMGQGAFMCCYNLTTISFPSVTNISAEAFRSCHYLTTVSFPVATTIGGYAFWHCFSLTIASFPVAADIGTYAFYSCHNLISLYLNNVSAIPTLGTAAFNLTPISTYSTIAGRYGSIFVPSSLYTDFTTATGWTAYSARMVSV